ncbi:MAG: carboxypeptidase regulatory-like domain-containing protein, partial [Terracidiphilus sp.]
MAHLQTHERTGRWQAEPLSLWRLAARTLWAAFLLATPLIPAQEQPAPFEPPPPPVQEPQAVAGNATSGVLADVHGVVRNAATGEPLPRALVRIEGDADTGTLTDGEGRFELGGVPVGPQTIQVRKPGFQDRPYATEDAGYQGDGPAHNVLVAAEMPDLDFALSPTAAIRGHIELSTGDPAQGIALTLLKQVVRNGRAVWAQNGTTKTNGEGAYRFANLPAGVYALYTMPTLESEPAVSLVARGAKVAREGYPSVFYPDAREFSGAGRIQVKGGDQAEANLRLTLEPFHTVTATAILPNGKPFEGEGYKQGFVPSAPALAVEVQDATGARLAYSAQYDTGARTIQASLPDGTYTLLAVSRYINVQIASTRQSEFLWGIVGFSVDGHAVSNLRIPLAPMPAWPIQVRTVGTLTQIRADAS